MVAYSKNEFSKKYQYSKNDFSKKYQHRKNELVKNIITVRTSLVTNITVRTQLKRTISVFACVGIPSTCAGCCRPAQSQEREKWASGKLTSPAPKTGRRKRTPRCRCKSSTRAPCPGTQTCTMQCRMGRCTARALPKEMWPPIFSEALLSPGTPPQKANACPQSWRAPSSSDAQAGWRTRRTERGWCRG